MNRAEEFVNKNLDTILKIVSNPKSISITSLADFFEQFHKECLPTDEEINKEFKLLDYESQDSLINTHRKANRYGAFWCRDFVREEPKENINVVSTEEYIKETKLQINEFFDHMLQEILNR